MKSRELPGLTTQGVAGTPFACDLETAAGRVVQAAERRKRRASNLEAQAELRKAAVERRKQRQMRAAEYARDRRASA